MKVIISRGLYQKINHWVHKAGGKEVSGLGKLKLIGNDYVIQSVLMLKQKNSAADTELQASDVAKAIFKTKDEDGMLNWWWHSHHSMGVFWSSTDSTTIRELGEHGFIVATVFNNKNESKSAFYKNSDDIYPEIYVDDIPTVIQDTIPQELIDAWDKEYDDNVVKTTLVEHGGYKYGQAYGSLKMSRKQRKKAQKEHEASIQKSLENLYGDWPHDVWDEKDMLEWEKATGVADDTLADTYDIVYPHITSSRFFGTKLKTIAVKDEEEWWHLFYDEYDRYPYSASELDGFYIDEFTTRTAVEQ
jgi:hypothetical protein